MVYSGKGLRAKKGDGVPLAWVIFGFGKNKCSTAQIRDRSPKWNEENTFTITDPKAPLKLTVKDKDDTLGQIQLPLIDIPHDEHTFKWIPVGPHRRNLSPSGEICFDCWIVDYKEGETPKKDTNFFRIKQKLNLKQLRDDARGSIQTGAVSMKGSVSVEDLSSGRYKKSSLGKMPVAPVSISSGLARSSGVYGRKTEFNSPLSKLPGPADILPTFEIVNVTEIKFFTPVCGSVSGGTLVHITGKNLGKNKMDVVGLKIAGSDCLATLEYHSPNKLVCTTTAGRGTGPVAVTTASGGTSNSKVSFEFEENDLKELNNGFEVNDVSEKKLHAVSSEKKSQNSRRFSLGGGKSQEKKPASQDLKKDVDELTNEVQVLKNENTELKQYVDKLLLYLMEKYPEALESQRLYR